MFGLLQKFSAIILLFVFFFGQITGVSLIGLFGNTTYAENKEYHELVSVIVDEKTYSKLKTEIDRYAVDIQNYLNNTRVVILPIKDTTTPFQISSLNESLFYEGYKSLKDVDFESRLVGTVLIGKIPLPVLSKDGKLIKSIIPYVDFEDKAYIYNPKNNLYEFNDENKNGFHAEIWQGVISPNSGNEQENIKELRSFFDKDHNFYIGSGLFSKDKEVLNGKLGEETNSKYKPFVFYFDELREQKSLSALNYKGYEAYLNNKEDIKYQRYTKDLAKKIRDEVMGEANKEIGDLIKKLPVTNKIDTSVARAQAMLIKKGDYEAAKKLSKKNYLDHLGKGPDLSIVNDIQTKVIIDKATKKFVEIFNHNTISNFRSNVYSAGRYNGNGSDVRVDLIPGIISILDLVGDNVLKATNDELENQIDKEVKNKLAKKIKIPTKKIVSGSGSDTITYENYFAGRKASDLKTAEDCSIYRGNTNSGQLCEANRGLNFEHTSDDAAAKFYYSGNKLDGVCNNPVKNPTGVYAGSTPLNLDINSVSKGNMKLKSYDINKAVLPIFDIKGSKKITDSNKNPSPKDCLKKNFIKTYGEKQKKDDTEYYEILKEYTKNTWKCKLENKAKNITNASEFVEIPSFMMHKAPLCDTIAKQLKNGMTPNVPVDKNRYIDFFTKPVDVQEGTGIDSYAKIDYPALFRVRGKTKEEIIKNLNDHLENVNKQIKKTGGNLDLVKYLKNKPLKTIKIGGEDKIFSYYDFLVFAIFWNNMKNISAKYKFVIEDYLSDEVGGNNFNFVLAKNKKQYEIAYLGAHGDARNMYIKMDPKSKMPNPYAQTFSDNAQYNFESSIFKLDDHKDLNPNSGGGGGEGMFKCAPPDGVPLWAWLPAIICRLKSLLPPKVGVEMACGGGNGGGNGGGGGKQDTGKAEEESEEGCVNDFNKNGINDCLEDGIKGGKLKFSIDKSRYKFNETGTLKTQLVNKDGKDIRLDNASNVEYILEKIIDKSTGKVVFDAKKQKYEDSLDIINKYVFFNPTRIKSSYGATDFKFTTKDKEADIYFRTKFSLKPRVTYFNKIDLKKSGYGGYDYKAKISDKKTLVGKDLGVIKLTSDLQIAKVRKEHLFIDARYSGENTSITPIIQKIEASDKTNIYLLNGLSKFKDFKYNKKSLILNILNLGNNGEKRTLNYPLKVSITDNNGRVIQEENIKNINGSKAFASIKTAGEYIIKITDKYGYNLDFNFTIDPAKAIKSKIDLGSSLLSYSGATTTNLVSVYDKYNNIVSGDILDYKMTILGDGLTFENGEKSYTTSTFEGFSTFKLKSNGIIGNSKVKIDIYNEDDKILSTNKNIRTLKDIKLDLKFDKKLVVGNNNYTAHLTFKDNKGNILKDLNSRVYLNNYGNYFNVEQPYFGIKSGEADIKLSTKILAGEDIALDFLVEGFSGIITKNITIFPSKPMSLDILPTKVRLEASQNDYSKIRIELKDVYNNTVFTDNNSKINLELLNDYKDILNPETNSNTLKKGGTTFKINATQYPGIAYLKFKINKNLENNEVVLKEGKKQERKIKGVSENAIKLETFYFWKKDKILNKKYNALYTTLLGAEYGDFTQKDYLASGILFDNNNRGLAVTSLLNSPYAYKDAFTISDTGLLQVVDNAGDLSQDLKLNLVKSANNKYYINLYNSALNVQIGRLYLNFDNLKITDDLFAKIKEAVQVKLSDFGINKFEFSYATTPAELKILLNTKQDNLILYLDSSSYLFRKINLGKNTALAISYNDPFAQEYTLNDFAMQNENSFENFEKNKIVGWGNGNKTLLEFASGVGAGESARKYMGISTVTLGDPVVSLKKIKKKIFGMDKKYDYSIGTKLTDTKVRGFRKFDYNNDNREDILLINTDGFLSLLENQKTFQKFKNQKHLARVVDLGKVEYVATGDFSGDGYDDIFFANKAGEPFLLNNATKDFTRISLIKNFALEGRIIAAKAFDMDNDGVDDIVIMDSSGTINIFYGQKGTTDFVKKTVYTGYGIKLDGAPRTDLGAIYFEGLEKYNKTGLQPSNENEVFPESILYNNMFEILPYDLETDRDKYNYTGQTQFLKSEFAKLFNIQIQKTFKDVNGGFLKEKDKVEVTLKIKNRSGKKLNNIVYTENIPRFFTIDMKSIQLSKDIVTRENIPLYKFYLDKFSLNPGEEVTIKYSLKTKPLIYKYIEVGLFEKGEAGDDKYGDIIVKETPYNCGGNTDLFRSIEKRTYQKGVKAAVCYNKQLPEELAKNDTDDDGNGIPDYIDNILNNEEIQKKYQKEMYGKYLSGLKTCNNLSVDDVIDEDGLDDVDETIKGFDCGFGGKSCFGMPMNWAPLAPGNDPVMFGKLIGDGLKIDEGIPVFSALTWKRAGFACVPTVFPDSVNGPGCVGQGAGGYLGINSPTNFFRFFITPTLTGSWGIAACFGAPAKDVGQDPPLGLTPVIPGGNCIVWAKKLKNTCHNPDPTPPPVSPIPTDCTGPDCTNIIIPNCDLKPTPNKLPLTNKIDTQLARKFLEYKKNGTFPLNLNGDFDKIFDGKNGVGDFGNKSLVNLKNGDENSVQVDNNSGDDNSEIVERNNKRIPGFPSFIMEWFHRQTEQFITKLTKFPTLKIILPDTGGMNNSDENKYADNLGKDPNSLAQTSGIKEAYNFLGRTPFIKMKKVPINVSIPWGGGMKSNMAHWNNSMKQYNNEISRTIKEAGDKMRAGNIAQIKQFQSSVRQNMAIIQSYAQIPNQIAKLATKKKQRLKQILCYINTIKSMMSKWIGKNGKRYKAWVKSYQTTKSALNSWQALINVFISYDAECHVCKNARHDSLNFQFKLIDMITPKIPVIKFPKLPDVVLDLHNIRMGMQVSIPEFKFSKRTMVMPNVPSLKLPSVSQCMNFNIKMPKLPRLPTFKIPDLPNLPPIPKPKLPNLPPPPKLPKMFASLKGVTVMMKLITKAMCILKKLPFVPEIRAGDQIAFLTEAPGYRGGNWKIPHLNIDFVNQISPNFEFPFVDEIQIKVYINLQKNLDFLAKMAKAAVKPINKMTSNFSNMFGNMNVKLDFSGMCGGNTTNNNNTEEDNWQDTEDYEDNFIDENQYEINENKNKKEDIKDRYKKLEKYYNPNSINPNGTNKIKTPGNNTSFNLTPLNFAKAMSFGIKKVSQCIKLGSKNEVSADEFLSYVNRQLSDPFFTSDPRFDELRKSFDVVNNYTYSREDRLINELQDFTNKKYDTLKSIIEKEIENTDKLQESLKNINETKYKTIGDFDIDKFDIYNKALEPFNKETKKAYNDLLNPKYFNINEIKKSGDNLKKQVSDGLIQFHKDYFSKDYLAYENKLLAGNVEGFQKDDTKCNQNETLYKRKYKGIYIVQQKDDKKASYKLFNYEKELNGKEQVEQIDYDLDGDEDLLYFMNGNLYLKENLLKKSDNIIHLSGVEILDSDDNKFINGEIFHEAVNDIIETLSANNYLNVGFSASKDDTIHNYRLSFFQIIDKYQNLENSTYIPKNIKRHIIDSFEGIGEVNKIKQTSNFVLRKNLAYIYEAGENIGKVVLKTKKLRNIKNSLKNGKVVKLSSDQQLYAGNNAFEITYLEDDKDGKKITKKLKIEANTNISFTHGIDIIALSGDAYIVSLQNIILKGKEIYSYIGLPLDFETKITLNDDNFITNSSSHIGIRYYDGTNANLDFRKLNYYLLYNLGDNDTSYLINVNIKNDYYYARMQNFKNNVWGTKTSQILLSPQLAADDIPPEINIGEPIRIPVYQPWIEDITDSIYENGGIENIKSIKIDGIEDSQYRVSLTNEKILLHFKKFNTIFTKKVNFIVTDKNNNISKRKAIFEVYTPIPNIENITSSGSISGIINEKLTDEPINIFRVRGGLVKKIETISGFTRTYTKSGSFVFPARVIKSNFVSVKENGKEIFKIDEYTGRIIGLSKLKYHIKTFIGKSNLINIGVYKNSGKELYREKFDLEKINSKVRIFDDFNSVNSDGLYFRFLKGARNNYDYYEIPDSVQYNPGAFVIYNRSNKTKAPIFVILPDLRVKLYSNIYKLEYSEYKGYVMIKLIHKVSNKTIGELLLKINNTFVIR